VKKTQPDKDEPLSKKPRTELDVRFLAIVAEYMSKRGISSDRAMSLALGRSENFLNRVRNGYQSATPEAWGALFDKYPEAQNTTTNVMAQGGGQAVGTNHGTMSQGIGTVNELEKHIDDKLTAFASKHDLVIMLENAQIMIVEMKSHNEQLKSQLADKERIIKLLEQSLNKGA
jgi:hypothetical protein